MPNFSFIGVRLVVRDLASFNSALGDARRQITFLGSSSLQLGQQTQTASKGLSGLTSALTAPGRAIATFGKNVRTLGTNIRSLGNETAALGFRLTFLTSIATASIFSATISSSLELEKTFTELVNLTDITTQGALELKDAILELAVPLGQTPAELSEGLFAVASAGITDTSRVLDILTASAKASAIGLGETEVIGRAVTAVMLAYGDSAGSAAQITDTLAAVVDQGNVEIDQFAGELSRVIGIGAIAGVSLQELGAFIATFTQAGASGAEAITALRSALNAIIKPSDDARAALAEYGLSIEDIRKGVAEQGLTQTLIALSNAVDGNAEALSRIFPNIRAFAGVVFVAGEASTEFLDNLDKISKSAGIIEDGFKRVEETTGFQLEQLRASFAVAGVTIGDIFLPALNSIITPLLKALALISEFAKQNPKIILVATAFALLAAALGPVLIIVGLLISAFGTFISLIGGVVAVIGTLLGPIALVGAALLGLVTIGGLWLNSLRVTAQDAGKTFEDIAREAFSWGANIVIQLANGIASAIHFVIDQLIILGRAIAHLLSPGSPPLLLPDLPDWGANIINELLGGFANADFDIFNDLASVLESALRSLGDAIPEESLIPSILGSRGLIAEAISQFREFGVVSQDVLSALTGQFGALGNDLSAYIQTLFQLQQANEAVAASQEAINQINERFEQAVGPLNDELQEIADFRDQIAQNQRIEELQSIIDSEDAPELARQLALLELREIELQNQIAAQEDQRDSALEGAEAQLTAAEEAQAALEAQAEGQLALINAQIQNNNLVNQQIDLLSQLAEEIGGVGGAIGGLGDDLEEALGGGGLDFSGIGLDESLSDIEDIEFPTLEEVITDSLEQSFNSIKLKFQEFVDDLSAPFAGIQMKLEELGRVWAEVFANLPNIPGKLSEAVDNFQAEVDDFVASSVTLTVIAATIEARDDSISESASTIIGSITAGIGSFSILGDELEGFWAVVQPILQGLAVVFGVILVGAIALVVGAFNGLVSGIEPILTTLAIVLEGVILFATGVIQAFTGLGDIIIGIITGNREKILAGWELIKTGVTNIVVGLVEAVVGGVAGMFLTVIAIIRGLITGVLGFFENLLENLTGDAGVVTEIRDNVEQWFSDLKDSVLQDIENLVNDGKAFFTDLLNAILGVIAALRELLGLQGQVDGGKGTGQQDKGDGLPPPSGGTSGANRFGSTVAAPAAAAASFDDGKGFTVNFNDTQVKNGYDLASLENALRTVVAGEI